MKYNKIKSVKSAIVYPYFHSQFEIGLSQGVPLHGIGSIIAYCKQNGESVDFINGMDFDNYENFADKIKEYDLVGYSIVSLNKEAALKAIEINKKANQNVIITVGGSDPSIRIEEYSDNELIDQIITGEGEIAFFELIQDVKNNASLERIVIGKKVENLDSIEFIDRSLFPKQTVEGEFYNGVIIPSGMTDPFFTILSGRVCVYNCTFCQPVSKLMFGKKERSRSAENVVAEIKYLHEKYGMKSFHIMDDNAFQKQEYVEKLMNGIEELNLDLKFGAVTRADNLWKNRAYIPKLKKLGLCVIFIGFESGSDKILKYLKKGTTASLNEKAAQILVDNDITTLASLMFGFPIETKEDLNLTKNFVKKFKNFVIGYNVYNPLPGSVLYYELKDKGLLNDFDNVPIHKHFVPRIKNVKYLNLYWFILKCSLISSKTNFEKKMSIFRFYVAVITTVKCYIRLKLKK